MQIVLLPQASYIVLVVLVVLGGTYDLASRRIPNWITIPGLVIGLTMNTVRDQFAGLEFALLGLGAALAIYIPLYLLRGMGAGDVKLMGAIGAIVGPTNWILIFLASAIIGGGVALILVLLRGQWRNTMLNVSLLIDDLIHLRVPYRRHPALDVRSPETLRLPHGVSIAGGALLVTLSALKPF